MYEVYREEYINIHITKSPLNLHLPPVPNPVSVLAIPLKSSRVPRNIV